MKAKSWSWGAGLLAMCLGAAGGGLLGGGADKAAASGPVNLGTRLELFLDHYLIDSQSGVDLRLHPPRAEERVFQFDQPWEGNTPFHITILQDGELYRMYYRGSTHNDYIIRQELEPGEEIVPQHPEVTACAESRDGIHWERPVLRQVEFDGSRENNILELKGATKFNPFLDTNPSAPPSTRYKAVGYARQGDKRGLVPLASPDGLRWEWMHPGPVITDGVFDSHNTAFWDGERGRYVAIYRDFQNGVRSFKIATSSDFLRWTPGQWADFGDAPFEQLYTNAALPYPRAPHILVGFPKRFIPWRAPQHHDYQSETERPGLSDAVFMSSRNGLHWTRFAEAFIRPGREHRNWIHRTNFVARGLLATGPDELSLYVTQHYTYPSAHLRRMVVRTDGFVSVHAGYPGGEFRTRPLTFSGENLILNYSTSAAGSIRVEIQDENGLPIPGFSLQEAVPVWGDEIEGAVRWSHAGRGQHSRQLARLAGKTVRLRFLLSDADLYSMRFR